VDSTSQGVPGDAAAEGILVSALCVPSPAHERVLSSAALFDRQ
jgi:hypothetical protein